MNKKIFSAALFGALMMLSAGTFTSCKDYDDDIDRIDTELSGIKSQLEALENKIKDGKWITSVTPTANGLTITLSDSQTYEITNGKNGQDGAPGAAGTEWTISEDGYWVCNGEKTDVKAVGQDGEKGDAGQQEVKFENGKWFLWNGTEFVEFKGAATSGNIPFYYTDPNDQNYTILVVFDENGQNKKEIRLPMNEGLAQISVLNNNAYLSVNYTIAGEIKWDGAKAVPAKGDYLITQSFDSLLVQVTPTNYDLAAISSFSLVNSLNEAAPVTIGAPVAFNQVLNSQTRTVSEGGLYKMAVTPKKITDEDVEKYSNSSTAPYLSLVANDKVRSNYEFTYYLQDCSSMSPTIKFESGQSISLDGGTTWIPSFRTKPGEALTIKASYGAEYLYDAYLTVKDINNQKADSIKWGIETGKTMTIQSNEKAQGSMVFVVRYLDVTGQVSTTDIYVNFSTPSTEEVVTSIPTTPHVATAESGKNFMLVDFAPYFKDMSESDRILWNADAHVNIWNTNVKWVYTDERTGRTVTKENLNGLISSIELADADGKVLANVNNRDLSKFAKLKVTFTNNYGATQGFDLSKGEFTAAVQISGAKEGVYQTVEIPFTVANPTAAEIAKQYTFNASYFANNTFTFLDATNVDLSNYISGSIDYSGAKDTDYLTFNNSTVTMTTEAEIGTAYPVEGLKVNFLGRKYDIPTFNVKFVNSKAYSVNVANAAVSLVSGGSSATIFYAEKATTDKPNFYNVKDASGKFVAVTSVDNIAVESANPNLVTATKSGNDIEIVTVDRVTVDTPVKVKVTATVDGEEFSAEFTVTVKAFPTE